MSALLTALLAWLGPIVGKLILDWLKDLFPKAEKKAGLQPGRGDDTPENRVAVLQAAVDMTKGRPFKRMLLRHLKSVAERDDPEFTDTDKAQIKDLVSGAKKE